MGKPSRLNLLKKGFLKEGLAEVEEEVGTLYQEVKHGIGKFTDCVDNNHVFVLTG